LVLRVHLHQHFHLDLEPLLAQVVPYPLSALLVLLIQEDQLLQYHLFLRDVPQLLVAQLFQAVLFLLERLYHQVVQKFLDLLEVQENQYHLQLQWVRPVQLILVDQQVLSVLMSQELH